MLHPVGSLTPRTYWMRRAVGIGVVLLVALLGLLLLPGDGNSEAAGPPATRDSTRAGQTPQLELVSAVPLGTEASSSPTPTGAGSAPTTAAPTTAAPTSAAPTSAASTSVPPAGSSPPPAAAVACTNQALAVIAGSTQPTWAVSADPVVTMTVTNASPQPCTRDVGQGAQEWLLFRGDTRVWGSNDCQKEPGQEVATLQPGDQVTLQVEWTGLTSEPGCAAPRDTLTPGAYSLVAVLGGDRSEPFALTFT